MEIFRVPSTNDGGVVAHDMLSYMFRPHTMTCVHDKSSRRATKRTRIFSWPVVRLNCVPVPSIVPVFMQTIRGRIVPRAWFVARASLPCIVHGPCAVACIVHGGVVAASCPCINAWRKSVPMPVRRS
ncbi:hypothetical protein NL676_007047 [Syzygium grande]|nr:hypothetical protein NL676_007047 [Syzygium grande]